MKQLNLSEVLYTGVFINDPKEAAQLYSLVYKYNASMRYAKGFRFVEQLHVTTTFAGNMPFTHIKQLLNMWHDNIAIIIDGIGWDVCNRVIALRVYSIKHAILGIDIRSVNNVKHITLATANNGKPKESNDITVWHDLEEPVLVQGVMSAVFKTT